MRDLLNMDEIKKNVTNLEEWCIQNNRRDLLEQWHPTKNGELTPINVSYGSKERVWWLMPYDDIKTGRHYIFEWEARVSNRAILGRGCPYLSNTKLLAGFNDFETWCNDNKRQDLLEEWNYEKNEVKPSEIISSGAGKKYWWKGKCGHEWDSVISSRIADRLGKNRIVKPSGCPYCSNPPQKVLYGFNDLETYCKNNKLENILEEWDYERNQNKTPREFTHGSGSKVFWKCNKNHVWETAINSRTSGARTGCPICSRGQTSFPEQAVAYYVSKIYDIEQRIKIKGIEADIYIPQKKIAIEYDGKYFHEKDNAKKREEKKNKVFKEANIRLIRIKECDDKNCVEGDVIRFVLSYSYINDDFKWAILKLFELIAPDQAEKIEVDLEKEEKSIKNYYMNTLKENSVLVKYPNLIAEWDYEKNGGLKPEYFSAHNHYKAWWKCKQGHSWKASISTRGVYNYGCPYCAGQKVTKGENDLQTWCENNNSSILKEWDYELNAIKPNEIPKTYKEKIWWKCEKNNHSWSATVYNRLNGTGCPKCNTGNNVARNKKTLEEWCIENNSNLLNEWNYEKNSELSPKMVTYGSHKKVWWKCNNGHEWEAVLKSRLYNHGCPYCSGTNKKAVAGVNDLETWCKENSREYILEEWDYEKNGEHNPAMFTMGSHKRIAWKCSKGHTWEAPIKERTKNKGNMCPICRR